MVHADHIVKLQEDLSEDEMPPEWMWPLSWEMETWLERVIKERKIRYGVADDDLDSEWEENEFAADWKREARV